MGLTPFPRLGPSPESFRWGGQSGLGREEAPGQSLVLPDERGIALPRTLTYAWAWGLSSATCRPWGGASAPCCPGGGLQGWLTPAPPRPAGRCPRPGSAGRRINLSFLRARPDLPTCKAIPVPRSANPCPRDPLACSSCCLRASTVRWLGDIREHLSSCGLMMLWRSESPSGYFCDFKALGVS